MMLHKKSERRSLLKLLALIPIVGLALALNARTVTDYVYDEPQKQQPVKKGKKAGTIKVNGQEIKVVEQDDIVTMEGEVDQDQTLDLQKTESVDMPNGMVVDTQERAFDVVEQMPEYPGGPQALFEFLTNNIQYPEEAEKAGIQGRVIATFVVEKDGSVSNAKVVKSVDPLLDAEALRVISAMPKWKPGKQNGKVVRVRYTVPLSFHFDGGREIEQDHICREDGSIVEMDIEREKSTVVRPLFIVDGQIMDGKKVYSINPKTIERFYMQDGQEAVEKYGEKAKEGVVIITLKKN